VFDVVVRLPPACGRLELRLPARASQAALLRAQLRLWLAELRAGDDDVADVLDSATRGFTRAIERGRLCTIGVEVEARSTGSAVEVVLHDYAGKDGNTVCLRRTLRPGRRGGAAVRATPGS
jgi:hypothetical protein